MAKGEIQYEVDPPGSFHALYIGAMIFLLFTAISTSDADLFLGQGVIVFPLFEIGVPIMSFTLWGTPLLLLGHLFFLLDVKSQYNERPPTTHTEEGKGGLDFFYFNVRLKKTDTAERMLIRTLIVLFVVVMPLAVQTLFFVLLLKYQDMGLSLYQSAILLIDVYAIWRFRIPVLHAMPGDTVWTRKAISIPLSFSLTIHILGITQLITMKNDQYSEFPFQVHFDLKNFDTPMIAAGKEKIKVRDRSFRYIEFSASMLKNIDFENCRFDHAKLYKTQLDTVSFMDCAGISELYRCTLNGVYFFDQTFDRNLNVEDTRFRHTVFEGPSFTGVSLFRFDSLDGMTLNSLFDPSSQNEDMPRDSVVFIDSFLDSALYDTVVYENIEQLFLGDSY